MSSSIAKALATVVALAAATTGSVFVSLPGSAVGAPASASAASTASPSSTTVVTRAKKADDDTGKWMPTEGLTYNEPRTGPETMLRIERQVVSAINHTWKGQEIRMVFFSFDRFPVADALIRAKKRGVTVQVIVNNHEVTPAQRKLRKKLGTNRHKDNFIYQCTNGCRSIGENQHDKFILFSKSGGAHNVVMFGSVNMKLNGAKNQYNDLWTVNEAPELYDALNGLYDQLREDKRAKPMYWQQVVDNGKYTIDAMPFPHATAKTDPLMKILEPIKCKNAEKPAGTSDGRTIIRVNMHAWDGDRGNWIARRFRELYAQGCDIKIQYGFAGKGVRAIFAQSTPRGRIPLRSNGFDTNDDGEIDLYTHMKNLIFSGHYGKNRSARFILTGSSNYQDSGLTGDELIIQMYSAMAVRQYLAQWKWMWDKHTRPVVYGVKGGGSAPINDGRIAMRTLLNPAGVVTEAKQAEAGTPTIIDPLGTDSPEWENE